MRCFSPFVTLSLIVKTAILKLSLRLLMLTIYTQEILLYVRIYSNGLAAKSK